MGVIALAVFAATPGARGAWIAPVNVSPAGTAGTLPQIGVDGAGNTSVVWTAGSPPNRSIRSAYRPAGGAWESSFTRMPSSFDCHDPQLAVNGAGAATVVADCDTSGSIRGAYRNAGGAWASSIEIPGTVGGAGARLGIDAAAFPTAVWRIGTGVWSSRRASGTSGSWPTAAVPVSPAGTIALDADIAVSPAGYATTSWRRDLGTNRKQVEVAARLGAAAWAVPFSLTFPATSTSPVIDDVADLRWNANNQRVAVWGIYPIDHFPLATDIARLQSLWGGTGTWGGGGPSHQSASDGVTSVEVPRVAIDDAGRSTAVWRSYVPGTSEFRIQASTTRFLNDTWSAPPTLLSADLIGRSQPQVAAAPGGAVAAVWRSDGGTTRVLRAARHAPGADFGPAAPVSDPSHDADTPRVVMSTGGDAVAVWQDVALGETRIAVAVDDVTPPALSGVVVPATVEVGTAAAMSVAATDAWSAPVTVTWAFGDGGATSGTDVAHTYATPGSQTVTITASDRAGNVATGTRAVAVTAPAVTGGGSAGGTTAGGSGAAAGGITIGGGAAGATTAAVLPAVKLSVSVRRQSWRAVRRVRAVTLRCRLDVAGRCRASATISRAVARRLQLRIGARARTLTLGTRQGTVQRGGRWSTLRLVLSSRTRAAFARTRRDVPLRVRVTGTAAGRRATSVTRALTIRR